MTDGTQQDQRFPTALSAGSVLVDGRDLSDILAVSRDYAHALTFYDTGGLENGAWGDLLDRDESLSIARGLAFRVDNRQQDFLDDLAAGRSTRLREHVGELHTWLVDWHDAIAATGRPEGGALADRMDQRIRQILGPGWQTSRRVPGAGTELRNIFFGIVKAIKAAQSLAATQLSMSLANEVHEPATALVAAVAQTYSKVQDTYNAFQGRHLDFYYHDYLRLKPRGATPDSVHLVAVRDPTFIGEVVVAAGQTFNAGRTASGDPILFRAVDDLMVTDAQVSALKTLRFDRDERISPECLFGFITSARAAEFGADVGVDAALQREAASLMGGFVPGCVGDESSPRIGLAVSSPVLWLSQGARTINLRFGLDFRGVDPRMTATFPSQSALVSSIKRQIETADTRERYLAALGRLFSTWLLSNKLAGSKTLTHADGSPVASDMEELIMAAATVSRGSPPLEGVQPLKGDDASDIWRGLLGDSFGYGTSSAATTRKIPLETQLTLAREELFATFFTVELSTAAGWCAIADPIARVSDPDAVPNGLGPATAPSSPGYVALELNLRHEDPAIVACSSAHGPEWPTGAPVVRLTLQDRARAYPLSIFDAVVLTDVSIKVHVEDLRDLRAFNQVGQVDPSKPFQPFGPIPDTASYLVIGAPETARKSLTSYTLNFDWAGLPDEGFERYYEGYDSGLSDGVFQVTPFALRDGRWQQLGPPQALFKANRGEMATSLPLTLGPAPLGAYWRATERELVFDQNARDGFLKLQLTAPKAAFGHAIYPSILAAALRDFKNPAPPPNPPYTPVLAGLSLTYDAATQIPVGAIGGLEQILHLHPFGVINVRAAQPGADLPPFLPDFARDGQLLIGLAAQDLQGELDLLFELRPDTAGEISEPLSKRPVPEWAWLANDGWTVLGANRVVSDTTRGFLTTGIVRLDLPPGLSKGNSLLSPDLFWLRVNSDLPPDSFAGLLGVKAQALVATRVLGEAPEAPLPAGSITLKSASIPGVIGLSQPAPGFGLRPAETPQREQTRIGERLRHKMRASTAWDYERLVLEAFPNTYKARCLPATSADPGHSPPGDRLPSRPADVLVVVVPMAPAGLRNDPYYSTRALRLNGGEIEDIERYLPTLASPFSRIRVINATYEYIQVRCRVVLSRGAHIGETLNRINGALVKFLSPWCDGGYPARFDWTVRSHDIEGCIRTVDQVLSVTGVSLMRIWEDDRQATRGNFLLDDTARLAPNSSPPSSLVEFKAHRPWSLALPLRDHIIEISTSEDEAASAQATGLASVTEQTYADAIAGLQIGETFIVDKSP